jgi:tRNA threonylcarbamoyladenosine biosynthesis protein TsaB
MNILAFDTCLDACSAAVFSDASGGVIRCAFEPMATGQAERLIPMIAELMSEAGLAYPDIHRIAVTVGPGTFTGTRIAIAAARAMALATDAEVVSATSLSVIAQQVVPRLGEIEDAEAIAVAVDARRGQLYWQRFAPAGGLVPLCEPQLVTPEQAAQQCAGATHAIAGSGAETVASHDPGRQLALAEITLPRAADLAAMAPHLTGVGSPKPLYLRPADAKPQIGKTIERVPT